MPDAVDAAPPEVAAADEGRHPPGPEPLWNESWYFDVADPRRDLGAFLRFGLYPNRDQCWIHVAVVGGGLPVTMVVVEDAALPAAGTLSVEAGELRVAVTAEQPLDRWRVVVSGPALYYEDAAAVLARRPAGRTDVELDLWWTDRARPYHYGVTSRYEVSCSVEGSLRVGSETVPMLATGQRDHSWGVRDWWAFAWCWSAGALDDGTAFHLADIRLPSGGVGFGYLLPPDGQAVPAGSVTADETVDADGLPTSADLELFPGPLALHVAPVAVSPLVFTADDGRTSRLSRALCRYTTADGRRGTGWTEWNLPVVGR